MNLQPLYDVKERLEQVAIAGAGLLGEDFRLARAAESLKPLAAASPVFAKIDGGLHALLAAPPAERGGRLLDLLALVDAVAYTQGAAGIEGELVPLPVGCGSCCRVSYGQLQPLLTALTTTGGGRMEIIQSNWENHPEFFTDFRVLPALIAGLGDSYGEISELNTKILKQAGPAPLPLLKEHFDPTGKKEMARRVEVIAALAGADATPWLLEVLPEAKKDVRTAVLTALGEDPNNAALLLDLAKTERGKNREAVLAALAKQDGEAIQTFWTAETAKKPETVEFLKHSKTDWASDLAAFSLRVLLEQALSTENRDTLITREGISALNACTSAVTGKSSSAMLDCWRWIDSQLPNFHQMKSAAGTHFHLGVRLEDRLLDSLCYAGPGPLCDLCLELWERHKDIPRYLPHALLAAFMTRPAVQVYDTFAPYILTSKPLLGSDQKKALNDAALKGLRWVLWSKEAETWLIYNNHPLAQPLDPRWISRLTQAVWKTYDGRYYLPGSAYPVDGFDAMLARLIDPNSQKMRDALIPYFRARMAQQGSWRTYGPWLLRLGSSLRGVLKDSIQSDKEIVYLYYLWQLLDEAAKILPVEETTALLREVQSVDSCIHGNKEREIFRIAFPYTIAELEAGRPFPEWNVWWNIV